MLLQLLLRLLLQLLVVVATAADVAITAAAVVATADDDVAATAAVVATAAVGSAWSGLLSCNPIFCNFVRRLLICNIATRAADQYPQRCQIFTKNWSHSN